MGGRCECQPACRQVVEKGCEDIELRLGLDSPRACCSPPTSPFPCALLSSPPILCWRRGRHHIPPAAVRRALPLDLTAAYGRLACRPAGFDAECRRPIRSRHSTFAVGILWCAPGLIVFQRSYLECAPSLQRRRRNGGERARFHAALAMCRHHGMPPLGHPHRDANGTASCTSALRPKHCARLRQESSAVFVAVRALCRRRAWWRQWRVRRLAPARAQSPTCSFS